MHHRFHDEPEWYLDDQRSEKSLTSIKDAKKFIEKKFIEEWHLGQSSARSKQGVYDEAS